MKTINKNNQTLFLIFSLLFFSIDNYAQTALLTPEKHITQFSIDTWSTEKGLPSNSLLSLKQSSNGYLWISSFQGLFRFDGVKFDEFTTKNTPLFTSNSLRKITEHSDGTLFLCTSGNGLITYKNNKFDNPYNFGLGLSIEIIVFDTDDHAWIGTREKGVFELSNGKISPYNKIPELNNINVFRILKDNKKNIWFTTEGNGLIRLDAYGNYKVFTTADGLNSNKVITVFQDSKSRIWIGTTDGLCMYDWKNITPIKEANDYPIVSIIEDTHGSLWMASEKGILRRNSLTKKIEILTEKNGLPHKNIQDIIIDREGSLWFASYRAGLGRIREGKFSNYTTYSGLASKAINAICEMGENTYLAATGVGIINKIENNNISKFEFKTNLPNDRLKHLNKDSRGNILVSTYSGLLIISPNGKEKLYNTKNGFPGNQVRMTWEDHNGNIWAGTRAGGLIRISPDGKLKIFNRENSDLSSNFIMTIKQDNQNNLLVGYNGTGIDIIDIDNGFKVKNYSKELTSNLVFTSYTDDENTIWIGTNAGLNRLKNGKIAKMSTRNGLATDTYFDILEDDTGNFWVSSGDGVMRVSKQELNLLADGKKEKVTNVALFGKPDGMNVKECTGATFSLKTIDGKLMFPTLNGISYINPTHILYNKVKPPVNINKLIVDNKEIDIFNKIVFTPGQQRFAFNFTALSLIAPKKVFFKYKLENYDKEWLDAGTERQAVYTGLPYGDYKFIVQASNNDGVWNKEGASISFEIEPHFYETKFFYVFCIFLMVIIVMGIYNIRTKNIKRKNEELEALVKKRTSEINSQRIEIEKQKDKLQLAYEDISMLSKIGQEITSILDFDELIKALYSNINQLMKADGFGVGLYNKKSNSIDFKNYIENGETLPFHSEKIEDDETFSVKCYTKEEIIFIHDIKKEYPDLVSEHGLIPESIIYVPLNYENKAIGVITIQSFESNAYNDQHLRILQTLGSYISIALANVDSYTVIQTKNELITDSIKYAERIQQAVLPSSHLITDMFEDSFVFFSPKDIVSGDFYWFNQVENKTFLAVSDCTGHGVPGAFMSMIGSASLNEIVIKEQTYDPSVILSKLHQKIRSSLKQDKTDNRDGMDIALCLLESGNNGTTKLTFSGAKRPLYYTQNGELKELKGTRKSIGGIQKEAKRDFNKEIIDLSKGEIIYLFSDGIIDQNSPERKRFGTPKLKQLLIENISRPLPEQKSVLVKNLKQHQNTDPQRDDIAVLGVRV